MNRLQSRKQLLLSESELNRALLVQQFKTVSIGCHAMMGQARAYGTLASSAGAWIGSKLSSRAGSDPSDQQVSVSTTEHLIRTLQLLLEIGQEIHGIRAK